VGQEPSNLLAALDPRRSAVVEACAGSGKTWLLVSRMLRLLLAGARPSELLAITFTRKAAGEMQVRLDEWLQFLAEQPDDAVLAFLVQRGLSTAEAAAVLPAARGLLEQVLKARPGPMITTFHGWFFHLLSRAPLPLRLPGEVLDGSARLRQEAWEEFLEGLGAERGGPLEAAFAELAAEMALPTLRGLMETLLDRRAEWWAWAEGRADAEAASGAALAGLLGVDESRDYQTELLADAGWLADLRAYQGLLAAHGEHLAGDAERAAVLAAGLAHPPALAAAARAVLLTQKGGMRACKLTASMQKRLADRAQHLVDLHASLAERLLAAQASARDQRALRLHRLALCCGLAYQAVYQRLRLARGVLDFNDAEQETARLLADDVAAGALLEKLDARWRHLLLDEFQDTNPLQWRILLDWLAAYGGDGERPGVFLVGDPKQSIYRFRRAEPRLFEAASRWLVEQHAALRIQNNETRRCSPRVVAWLNAVFEGRADYPVFAGHSTHQRALAGWCELAVLAPDPAAPAARPYRLPLREPAPSPPDRRELEAAWVAQRIAAIVGRLELKDGPARYADITLLYASRRGLPVFERALRAAGVPYVSDLRGGLLDALEVEDICQLLRALIDPYADLALAQALKSPLFGFDDADLQALARREGPWQRRLYAWAEDADAPARVRRAAGLLAGWQALARRLPVHDLLDRIYAQAEVPGCYLRSVPVLRQAAVEANLAALIELSLTLSGGRYPSLSRFLDEVDALREQAGKEAPGLPPSGGEDAVRLMTIHSAKGLEAPVVFLIKADEKEAADGHSGVLLDWPVEARRPEHFSVYGPSEWRGPGRDVLFEREAAQAARERLNLLYVAMTRAVQALFVSGTGDAEGVPPAGSWLAELQAAYARVDWPGLPEMRWQAAGTPVHATAEAAVAAPAPVAIGCRRAATTPQIEFGIHLHAWLEWASAGLDEQAIGQRLALPTAQLAAVGHAARRILALPELAPAFDAGSYLRAWNEFEFIAPDGRSQRIDRLVEFSDRVWLLDYKSGGLEQPDPAVRAEAHRAQIEAYVQAAEALLPGKPVEAGLVFADGLVHWLKPARGAARGVIDG
jgi:ATP-dependent helicase/nuclease subunit A